MIDEESLTAVTTWLRLGDKAAGRKPIEGRCDRCGAVSYLSRDSDARVCARCYLDGIPEAS